VFVAAGSGWGLCPSIMSLDARSPVHVTKSSPRTSQEHSTNFSQNSVCMTHAQLTRIVAYVKPCLLLNFSRSTAG